MHVYFTAHPYSHHILTVEKGPQRNHIMRFAGGQVPYQVFSPGVTLMEIRLVLNYFSITEA